MTEERNKANSQMPVQKGRSQGGHRRFISTWQIAGALLLIGVLGLLGFAFWPESSEKRADRAPSEVKEQLAEITATVLTQAEFPLRVEATGHLRAWRKAEVSAEVQGVVLNRNVEEGQQVSVGTILFELDRRDFEFELEEARAEWLKIQAEYAVRFRDDVFSAADVDSTVLDAAYKKLQKDETAYKQGTLTLSELEASRLVYQGLYIQRPDVRKAVQAANIGLTQAEQRKARAELALSRTRIVAPFAGRVADVLVEEGQRVSVGQQVMTILDDRRMKVDVDVLEANIVQLEQGATALVNVPSLGEGVISGSIHSINPSIDAQTGAGRVTIAIPNRDGKLISGLFTYAYLESARLENRLILPTDAVLVRQGRDLVFRVENGRAQWVYVDVGARSGRNVEITNGLSPGDTIAVAGHFALAHDTAVDVKTTVPSFNESFQ